MSNPRLLLLNVVGLTPSLLKYAPALSALAERGQATPLKGVLPALTLSAQATMLTGKPPSEHGVVGNGWYRRDIGEARAWIQSAAQIQAERFDLKARKLAKAKGREFKIAHLFWWFAQGSGAELMLTPKPHYGADGSKAFDIMSNPISLGGDLERELGERFPFHTFWGPMAGLPASDWISRAAERVIERETPELTMVYLPHLDYDLQRFGSKADLARLVGEVDTCAARIIAAAESVGAE
ncbi:MAG: alkaline phosphatase family protein, partial [Planctomycetes bacterium]|nr:alkaline phosphatase family protein [Planctomycetota bacterium]